jgi:hexosaminidase
MSNRPDGKQAVSLRSRLGPGAPLDELTGVITPLNLLRAAVLSTMFVAMAPAKTAFDVMPAPAEMRAEQGSLRLDREFAVFISGAPDSRVEKAVDRALRRLEERTGLLLRRTSQGSYVRTAAPEHARLLIECATSSAPVPQLGENEAYVLHIEAEKAVLRAPTTLGVLRGLETLLQLVDSTASPALTETGASAATSGWFLPAVLVQDAPRFPWRGLMLDVARHWQPMDVIKRNLEGMAAMKLNVLHLHLTEDQGFRIESKTHPRLHQLGSDGLYFTQADIREIIAFAADRGIRVVPEFDIPGHATSWLVAYPELGSAPGPYVIERRWGIFDPVLDPTNEKVYALLADFLGEMAALFPDPYMHIGGDENNGIHWTANPRIQEFIRERNLKDNPGVHAYFNQRVQQILQKSGKRLVGWDEILHPDLSKDAVIHSWRGAEGLIDAARAGHAVILSNGYYIDLMEPASKHYANDPLPANTPLNSEEQARILGGEATMWAEWVSPETIDSRIWPRTAAIAERLWSPREVADVDDMYRRLKKASWVLSTRGLLHQANREPMLRRYAGVRATDADLEALRQLLRWVEPVKGYRRNSAQNDLGPSQFLPLTGLVDIAQADSEPAREFGRAVQRVVSGQGTAEELRTWVTAWRDLVATLATTAQEGRLGARSAEIADLSRQLSECVSLAEDILAERRAGKDQPRAGESANTQLVEKLNAIGGPTPVLEWPIVGSLKKLLGAPDPS